MPASDRRMSGQSSADPTRLGAAPAKGEESGRQVRREVQDSEKQDLTDLREVERRDRLSGPPDGVANPGG